jgi:hypothetical protein
MPALSVSLSISIRPALGIGHAMGRHAVLGADDVLDKREVKQHGHLAAEQRGQEKESCFSVHQSAHGESILLIRRFAEEFMP